MFQNFSAMLQSKEFNGKIKMSTQVISELIAQNHRILLIELKNDYLLSLQMLKDENWVDNFTWNLSSFIAEFSQTELKLINNISSPDIIHVILSPQTDDRFMLELNVKKVSKDHRWFYFEIALLTCKNIIFDNYAPEIKLKTSPFSKQDSKVIYINQPTRHTPHTDEWKSNDMPACYLWNNLSSLSTFFFVDFSEMEWMNPDSFERFSVYECSYRPDGIFGLLNRIQLPKHVKILSHNRLNYNFYVSQDIHQIVPNQWQAVKNLITRSFDLLPSFVPFPKNFPLENLSWTYFSQKCINDLLKENSCWIDPEAPKYFAYVQDESEKQRRNGLKKNLPVVETMTMLDILPPWILYLKTKNSDMKQQDHVKRSILAVKEFIDKEENFLYNNIIIDPVTKINQIIKPNPSSIGDSWYFFEPILRFAWIVRLLGLLDIKDMTYLDTFRNMANKSIEFVQKHNYEITAFYDPITLFPLKDSLEKDKTKLELHIKHRGKQDVDWKLIAKNYACLGIYIYIMIQAFTLFSDVAYLTEARKAADKFGTFSPDQLFWEPLELAYGVAGLTELFNLTEEEKYLDLANLTALNETRMFYWYEDNTKIFNWKNLRSNLGLVMACIGIRYPAMKENIESIYPFLKLLKTKIESGKLSNFPFGLLKFFNLIRINSFYYFSDVLDKRFIYPPRIDSPCKYIPFEDLEMLETAPHFSKTQNFVPKGRRTGILGREIYGAGEVIWLYLMFEAFAKCNDPEVFILNLDLFNFTEIIHFPQKRIRFLLYNPIQIKKNVQITFNQICGEVKKINIGKITRDNSIHGLDTLENLNDNSLSLELEDNEVLSIEVEFGSSTK